MNKSIHRGATAEMAVALKAMEEGYAVSFPFIHDSLYDLIIDINGKLIKIQVKRVYYRGIRQCVESKRIMNGQRFNYPKGSYDFLIAYNVDTGDNWLIPQGIANRYKAEICVSSRKMDMYKNNLDILDLLIFSK